MCKNFEHQQTKHNMKKTSWNMINKVIGHPKKDSNQTKFKKKDNMFVKDRRAFKNHSTKCWCFQYKVKIIFLI